MHGRRLAPGFFALCAGVALASPPPRAEAPNDAGVALLPGATRALVTAREGVWRVDLETGDRVRVADGGHLWAVEHVADGVRVGLGERIVTFDADGREVASRAVGSGDCFAFHGEVVACSEWGSTETVFEGWGVAVPGGLRQVFFTPDGAMAVATRDDGALLGIGPEGVRWTVGIESYVDIALGADRIFVDAHGDIDVRGLDGNRIRTVRASGSPMTALDHRLLAGDQWVDTRTGEVRALPMRSDWGRADARDGVVASVGTRAGRFELVWTRGDEVHVATSAPSPMEELRVVGDAVYTLDASGRVRMWEGGRQTGTADLGYDGGAFGFGVLPDGRWIRSGDESITRIDPRTGEVELAIPTTAWRSDVGVVGDRFVTYGRDIEIRGADLRIAERRPPHDGSGRRVLGPWVEVDDRWVHALTGEKRGHIEVPMVDGDRIADGTRWHPKAVEGAMAGEWVAIREYEDGIVHAYRGKELVWTAQSDGRLAGVLPDGRVLVLLGGGLRVLEQGEVRQVLVGLDGPDWAVWKGGELEVTGDGRVLWSSP